MIRELAVFERSSCRCQACRSVCTSGRPGALAPSDFDSLVDYFEIDTDDDEAYAAFLKNSFRAHEDGPGAPTDLFADATTPAIRPATKPDGRCVFLRDNGDCACHTTAPFECTRVNACEPEAGAAAMRALGVSITKSADYVQTWLWLRKQGSLVPGPAQSNESPATTENAA